MSGVGMGSFEIDYALHTRAGRSRLPVDWRGLTILCAASRPAPRRGAILEKQLARSVRRAGWIRASSANNENAPHHQHATYSDCVAHGEPSPLPTRKFQGNQFVYCVLSQRAGGLSVGIDLAPDKRCNFRCVYCEVDRKDRRRPGRVHVPTMLAELEDMLAKIQAGKLAELGFPDVDPKLLPLKSIALSGDGEPTLCPNFREILEAIVKLRARGDFPFFKIVLITNSTGLQFPRRAPASTSSPRRTKSGRSSTPAPSTT